MSKILILGANGFIGKNVSGELKSVADVLVKVDCTYDNSILHEYKYNISQTDKIIELIQKYSIDIVINLMSTMLPSSEYLAFEKEYSEVMLPSIRIVEYCASNNIKYIYFSSGGAVYGNSCLDKVPEVAPLNPINYYGYSKRIMEEFILFQSKTKDLKYVILRPSNPYGRHYRTNSSQGLVGVTINKILRKQPIEIWGDGNIVRDYVSVSDISIAVKKIISKSIDCEIFNLGSGTGYSIIEVINIVSRIAGCHPDIRYFPSRKEDPLRIVLDINKIKSQIDWEPISFEVGVNGYYNELKNEL